MSSSHRTHSDETVRHRKVASETRTVRPTGQKMEETSFMLENPAEGRINTNPRDIKGWQDAERLRNGTVGARGSPIDLSSSESEEIYSADPRHPLLEDDDERDFTEIPESPVTTTSSPKKWTEGESGWMIALQVFIPYIIAGFGTVGAGMVLDIVQHWTIFKTVSEVFILVPALLGLKGNLEMTLASRLSTQANLGNMESRKEQIKMIGGNLALTQAQAIVVGFLASIAAMVMGWIPEGKFDVNHGLLLCASSVLTASVASLILGSVMVGVILLSRKCRINPDNVATPVAASLGDLTTLTLLALISRGLFQAIGHHSWIAPAIIVIFLVLTPLWVIISIKNEYTNDVIYSGWTPVISAMIISSVGGLILDFAVANYDGIAVFQPVINGVGGNLVAVQASRISTSLHKTSKPGELPDGFLEGCPNPCFAFFGKYAHAKAAKVLMLMVIPGHLIFMYTISYMNAGHTSITISFALIYLAAAVLQVAILLYVANWTVHYIWKQGDDPDNSAIPYLTALGDLLGTGLLAAAFQILYMIGDKDADIGE